ncbi:MULTISPECIES: hypothetical protein [Bacteroidales]
MPRPDCSICPLSSYCSS